jgi:hypothetical protein
MKDKLTLDKSGRILLPKAIRDQFQRWSQWSDATLSPNPTGGENKAKIAP